MNERDKKLPAIVTTGLILEGDPEAQLDYAQKAAKALMKRVEAKPRKVIISGKQYLEFGDWQTVGRFFGSTVGIEWSRPIERQEEIIGYEARAVVYQHGQIISSAEHICLRGEKNWGNRDEYAVKSMAQTRAGAKALRNAFGWVAELAGYDSTPAEEMEDEETISHENTALFKKLDAKLAVGAEKGINALQEVWGGLTPNEQKLMESAKDNRHKPRAIEVSAIFASAETK
jgi:hypothetical protein